MVTCSISCSEAVKRFWRRRRYQRLPNSTGGRRRLKVVRLGAVGDGKTTTTTMGSTRFRLKISVLSPLRLLARFHDAYVETMMGISIGVARRRVFEGKRACKETQVAVTSTGEEVDQRLVLEVYRRIAASRHIVSEL